MTKRLLAILLTLALALGCFPVTASAQEDRVLTEEDYAAVDVLFDAIDDLESVYATKRSAQSQTTDAAQTLVEASDNYVAGSLERNGDAFTWMTEEGIRCAYSPRMRRIEEDMTPTATGGEDVVYNEPVTARGGWPSGNQVYLVGPYYGYDSDFTDQYKNEASRIAAAIGDTDGYTLYSGKAATVDTVAEAVSKGAVVIFDSHGNTDYESGYDCVTGATSSYLCLKSTTGLTSADYADGALYYSSGIFINGATIANHMTSQSPAGLVWMAICLGMATDTLCEPLRDMGVEVVCGYSQSVTFAGDYLFEDTFFDKLCAGETVATANAYMKSTWGNWDWSTKIATYYGYSDGYSTISAARNDYMAFPVVVSDEDAHPGQRNKNTFYGADSLQTVKSTYTLFSQYSITATSSNTAQGTVSVSGSTITATPATGYMVQGYTILSGSATVTQNGNTFSVQASSDCTIEILFAPKETVTVTFVGQETTQKTGYSGDTMTLPTASAPEGYTFQGWTQNAMEEASATKPACLTGSFIPTYNTTLYAVYSYVEEGTSSGTGDYVKVTETPADWTGEYLIVYEDSGYIFDGSLTSFDQVSNYKAVTVTNNTIPAAQGDAYSFTVEAYSTGYSIRGTSNKYIGHSTNANKITTSDTPLLNKLSIGADGSANIICSGGAYLRFNNTSGQYRFRYYKSSTYSNQKAICLYVKDGSVGTIWYTTPGQNSCDHAEVQNGACTACGTAFAARTGDAYWLTLQEAIDNANDGYVQLLTDADAAVTADTLYLDLNGCLLSEITVTGTLYGYDSSATAEAEGTGGILAVSGTVATDHTAEGVRYITLNSNGIYTFHVLKLSVSAVSLRTAGAGLYYTSAISCDEQLAAQIRTSGVAVSLVDLPDTDLLTDGDTLYSVSQHGVLVDNILTGDSEDADRAIADIFAAAYVTLSDGTVLTSGENVAYSLYDILLLLRDQNPDAFQSFCDTHNIANWF